MVELGIVDIREIIRLIVKNYQFDLSNFSLTSLKYRLEHIVAKNNLSNAEGLFRKLSDQPEFFDTFLNQLCVPSSEMFRDPSLWRWLRESYFPNLEEKHLMNFKIWLPYCVSGGELYSLTILLKEINLLDNVKIIATSFSDKSIQYIKSGIYPFKKNEISIENYKRSHGDSALANYYKREKYNVARDTSLIKNVEFIKDDINFNKAPKNIKLILMRNAFIYFNPKYQEEVLLKMHESLSAYGYLIIGLKEQIGAKSSAKDLFDIVELNESVYKRKVV
jgi:chemotaxis protein methyltransferase CheR